MISFPSGQPIDEADGTRELNLFDESLPKIDAYEVIAGAGNVLYLPPFWFHRVVTEDTSIALSA
jgi:ribosomal protein L16 Arg81 hydroxylase